MPLRVEAQKRHNATFNFGMISLWDNFNFKTEDSPYFSSKNQNGRHNFRIRIIKMVVNGRLISTNNQDGRLNKFI